MVDEGETNVCPNCKRDIPVVNFLVHTVHCARNLRNCPVCKEPVPHADLQEHHDLLHKQMPCKKCGESVCGTDLEDHLRDSCGHTIRPCRYCELELPRRELPAHEGYCGTRTEQCDQCREWVMIKYRQIHEDSNHGFIKLNEDPSPVPNREVPKNKPTSSLNGVKPSSRPANVQNMKPVPITQINYFQKEPKVQNTERNLPERPRYFNSLLEGPNPLPKVYKEVKERPVVSSSSIASSSDSSQNRPSSTNNYFGLPANSSGPRNGPNVPKNWLDAKNGTNGLKNYQSGPINGPSVPRNDLSTPSNVNSGLKNDPSMPRNGSAGLRIDPSGLQLGSSGLERESAAPIRRSSAKRTNDQPQVNITPEINNKLLKELAVSRGAVKKRLAPKPPARQKAPPPANRVRDQAYLSAITRYQNEEAKRAEQNARNLALGLPPVLTPAAKLEKLRKMDALQNRETTNNGDYKQCLQGRVWQSPAAHVQAGQVLGTQLENGSSYPDMDRVDLRDLKPMSPAQFMDRFRQMQLLEEGGAGGGARAGDVRGAGGDRFSEIKSSLRELRRGLNEVTAPYNGNSNYNNNASERRASPHRSPRRSPDEEDVRIPCEFCCEPVPVDDLVQHQTGCRPDLAQVRARSPSRASPRASPRAPRRVPREEPLIPCEFCTEPLPVYLINEHQERCGRESNQLFPN